MPNTMPSFTSTYPPLLVSYLLLLFLFNSNPQLVICSTDIKCTAIERRALVDFKQALTDLSGRLSSWIGDDCCTWKGITCHNLTGRVTKLDLRNPHQLINADRSAYKRSCLGGKIDQSLLHLEYLTYLDLSLNDFEGLEIPDFLGELKDLRYLNLSFASFGGEIPISLGNLSNLQYLDLYADSYSSSGPFELRSQSLQWLTTLSSLKHLNLGFVKLDSVGDHWLQTLNLLPSLVDLRLHWCELKGLPLTLPSINFSSLSVLDLSENSFNSLFPKWLFNLTSLTELYLTWDFFNGPIPVEFANLKNLQVLDLSNNLNLEGQIPGLFGNLTKLQFLDLSANNFQGDIYEFLNGFSNNKLDFLDLSSNSLSGELPESLGLLKYLQHLDLSSNSFMGSIPSSIGTLSSLRKLDLSYNTMNGTIPESLGQLSKLVDMNLMSNSWKGILKETHFMNVKKLQNVRLTTEPTSSLAFIVSNGWVPPFKLKSIQLENCMIGPSFPLWLQLQNELTSVILKNVSLSDTIPDKWFTQLSDQLTYLVLSQNQIKGKLPNQLSYPYVSVIDLSHNNFEGPFPSWSTNATDVYLEENSFSGPIPENIGALMPRLQKFYASRNHLSGRIPSSMCDMEGMNIISLRSNKLFGELPNCWHQFMLWGIDISNNSLTGNIPTSLGSLRSLSVLMLSNNDLNGEIPSSLQNCSGLTSIDLQGNRISGSLPLWIQNLASLFMLRLGSNLFSGRIPDELLCKLQNVHILDLSNNKISGSIPKCIGNLTALVSGKSGDVFEGLVRIVTRGRDPEYSNVEANVNSIDLSGNNLTGQIPDEITNLLALRSLNLSHNHLSGAIPKSLKSLSSLTRLNLSYNIFSGKIPFLPRFNDSSIYEGNPLLCGTPLPTKCPLHRPHY